MALTTKQRNRLPASDFALPGRGSGKKGRGPGSYPIDTAGRARAALSRGAANASPTEDAKIKRAVARKYPEIKQKGGESKGRAR